MSDLEYIVPLEILAISTRIEQPFDCSVPNYLDFFSTADYSFERPFQGCILTSV